MKRYFEYMDNIEVSDTLHQRLAELEPPKKRRSTWTRYGGLAAALILVAGAGAWGLSRGSWNTLMDHFKPNGDWDALIDHFESVPDIAIEDPDGTPGTETQTGGGYEVVHGGEGPDSMVSYYFLPYLNWADASAQPQTAMDYALAPPSAIHRDAALNDVLAFSGGERAMADHLLWDSLDWGGTLWFLEDGTPQAAFLHAEENSLSFSLEVMKGGRVPSCIVLPDEYYETSQWQEVEITAVKNGGYRITDDGAELREKREVSFFCGGVGYKLTLYAGDAARADEMCARFVRYAIDNGFHLDALSAGGAASDYSNYSVGEPNWEDGVPEEDGTPQTTPYDPGASDVDMVMTAPPN